MDNLWQTLTSSGSDTTLRKFQGKDSPILKFPPLAPKDWVANLDKTLFSTPYWCMLYHSFSLEFCEILSCFMGKGCANLVWNCPTLDFFWLSICTKNHQTDTAWTKLINQAAETLCNSIEKETDNLSSTSGIWQRILRHSERCKS